MKKNDIIEKKKKIPVKDKWETPGIIPLIKLLGVNHCKPTLYMSKRMVQCYSSDKIINKFVIGYMINPLLNCEKLFREKVISEKAEQIKK